MAKFRKAILRAGTYHSPDGKVEVTASRLKHWATQFQKMRSAKQVIPIDWDHGETIEDLSPVTMDQYKRRSAQTTVGHLHDFRLSDDGQSAEIELDVRTPKAAEQAELNNVYVSPVILPSWRDGAGNQYTDCITHVDFVNHPVDHSQGPFVPVDPPAIACALRMGLGQPLRMAMDDTTTTDDVIEEITEDEEVTTDDNVLLDVLGALASMDIVLPEDTTAANFLERLHPALLTAAAKDGLDTDGGGLGDETVVASDPGIATMSLSQKAAIDFAQKTHRKSVIDRMKSLLQSGRCTPAEHRKHAESLGAVKLSFDKSGKPRQSDLEKWIESREAVPKGTFWSPEQKTRLSATVADHPSSLSGAETPEEADKVADYVFGKR